jgi:acetylornithine deacetylase
MKEKNALDLLKLLIAIPSFSKEEATTAECITQYVKAKGVDAQRYGNNIYAFNKHYQKSKKNILLNSHHDTVKPNAAYTKNPFEAQCIDGKLYGLGANDAGASLVALIEVFLFFYAQEDLPFNLILAATAEEEISGKGGIECVLPLLPPISFAIIGEPTSMKMAIAERGLMVVDAIAYGTPTHVAHFKKDNALYTALDDIAWLRAYQFEKKSALLGNTKAVVTKINAGDLHNMVPDTCSFTIDIRVNDSYRLDEIMEILQTNMQSKLIARSMRLQASALPIDHPIILLAQQLGIETYGSPTISDMALIPCNAVKIGPGDSLRSHTADEFIGINELEEGIAIYKEILLNFKTYYETLG